MIRFPIYAKDLEGKSCMVTDSLLLAIATVQEDWRYKFQGFYMIGDSDANGCASFSQTGKMSEDPAAVIVSEHLQNGGLVCKIYDLTK